MPRRVPPDRWEHAIKLLRRGYGVGAVCAHAGISPHAMRAFLRGDPRSSGTQWLRLRRELLAAGLVEPGTGDAA